MLVEPGFFRTELLTPESTKYAKPSIDDYAERTAQTVAAWNSMNGRPGSCPEQGKRASNCAAIWGIPVETSLLRLSS